MKGRRNQVPLRYYIANTIHRIQGRTISRVVTEINNTCVSKRHLRLWERSQLLVLLSRVSRLSELYFVGPRSMTLTTMSEMLVQKNVWTSYITSRLESVARGNPRPAYVSNDN